MFTLCQTRKLYVRFSGDKKFLPKDLISDEMYAVIGVSHSEKSETVIKDDKRRVTTRHNFNFFVINEKFKIVCLPDYNCFLFLDDIVNAKKKE